FQDIRTVGEALELRDEAEELEAGLRYRLRRVAAQAQGPGNVGAQHAAPLRKPGVLVLEWLDPPYVAGHWVPELVALAGGQDVGSVPGEPSRPRPWDQLAALAPDVVVVAPCGFDVARARAELAAVTDPEAQALLGRRVELLDGSQRSGGSRATLSTPASRSATRSPPRTSPSGTWRARSPRSRARRPIRSRCSPRRRLPPPRSRARASTS